MRNTDNAKKVEKREAQKLIAVSTLGGEERSSEAHSSVHARWGREKFIAVPLCSICSRATLQEQYSTSCIKSVANPLEITFQLIWPFFRPFLLNRVTSTYLHSIMR